MTVTELIEELKKYDPELEVWIGSFPLTEIDIRELSYRNRRKKVLNLNTDECL